MTNIIVYDLLIMGSTLLAYFCVTIMAIRYWRKHEHS